MQDLDATGGEMAGLRYMALAAFFFSVMSLQVKLVGVHLPSQQVVFIRSLITLCLTWLAIRRVGVSPWGNNRRLLLVRGVTGFGALSCFFYSITHLPLAEATVIQFSNPLFTALLATILLGEAFTRVLMGAIAISLAGVFLIAQPSFIFGNSSAQIEPATLLIALCGALLTAAAYISVRRLAGSDHHLVVIFYFPLVCTPAAALTAIPGWVWPTPLEWVWLAGAGAATQLGQVFVTRGLYRAPAGPATAVGYIQIVFAALWGFLFFAEVPTLAKVLGTFLIVLSTFIVVWHQRRRPAIFSLQRPLGPEQE